MYPELKRRSRTLIIITMVAILHTVVLMLAVSRKDKQAPTTSRYFQLILIPPRSHPQRLVKSGVNEKARSASPVKTRTATRTSHAKEQVRAAVSSQVIDESSSKEKAVDITEDWAGGESAQAAKPGTLMERSRELARKIDKEERKGVLAPLHPVDTPFKRMQRIMENAYVGGGPGISVYTSPSGESITRVTRGGRTRCYIKASGTSPPSAVPFINSDGGSQEIKCPN